MQDFLFNTPWWAPVAISAVGIFVFLSGNRRHGTKVRNAGLAIALGAMLLAGVGYYIDTPLERAEKGTRQFVRSVIAKDANTLRGLMDPKARLTVLSAATPYQDREQIISGALAAVDQYGIKGANILSLDAEQVDTSINVTISVLSDQDATFGRPITTSWQFEWLKTAEGWRLFGITCLRIGDMEGDAASRQFPIPRLPGIGK